MSLKCCLRSAQCCVFALNFVVWVSGMAMLIGGLYLRMNSQVRHVMTAAYSDDAHLFHWFCYAAIAAGAITTFVGFLGCCSAYQESRCMLATFFVVLSALFAAELGGGVWVFLNVNKIRETIPATMADYVRNSYGKQAVTDDPFDYVQQTMRCCGGESPSDWASSFWFNETHRRHHHRRRHSQFVVPDSCCFERVAKANDDHDPLTAVIHIPQGAPRCSSERLAPVDSGCGAEMIQWLNDRLLIVAIVSVSLLGLQLAILMLTLTLCCAIRRQSAGGYKT